MGYSYVINPAGEIKIAGETVITTEQLLQAIEFCNAAIKTLDETTRQFDINIFETLGLRNLSGMVGEYFARSVQRHADGRLQTNLHQDGYPDLLLTNTPERLAYYRSLYAIRDGKKYPKDKADFSPFKYGGIEIKATCGNTPKAEIVPKPLIGEQRIHILTSFEWKAHHRETNNLLSVFWDFIEGVPVIAACFYRNDLVVDDWGKIVHPKDDGGRTTSVSIMKASGVQKMCHGWQAVIDKEEYISAFSARKWIGRRAK